MPSLIPSSFATLAIGRDVSITIFTASSLNSGEKLFFGRGNYFTFPDVHPIGWTVRKARGTSSGDVRLRGLFPVRPGGCLVVEGAGLEASVEDADEPAGEFAQGGVVLGAAGALGVVEGAGAGRDAEGGE